MAINTDLLISAAILQDYLVDKDTGFPLANGIISLFKDTSRSFYKNWYYQTGAPGAYSWIPLDNPLHLSSVGTIQDPNGNDVIPFFYPYDEEDENTREAYYITVYSVDENGDPSVLQFTRENFPFLPSNVTPIASVPTWRNYILNNVYWRNAGSINLTSVTDRIVAPSQHDGFTNGDIRFRKNVTGANDNIAFSAMTETLDNDITPEYMINFQCNGTQVGETLKCIQYPISLHVKTLQNVLATVVFHGQNVAGNPNNYVDLYIYQFMGTGALVQPDPILIRRVTLNNDFQKFVFQFTFPDATDLTPGSGGDDALFLQVQYPLSSLFQINHTKPQIYLSADVPDNDFDTYDQIETIINSPRTGDVRTSLNDFYYFGEVPMNGGTIGNASSNATARANIDTWPLFNLLWGKFSSYTSGTTNLLAQMKTSAGADVAYGASAIADFNANKALTLTKMMGQVILGTVPVAALLNVNTTTVTATSSSGLLLTAANTVNFFKGMPIYFTNSGGTLPTGLSLNTIYYVGDFNGTTAFHVSTTFANAMAGTYIAYTDAGTGTHTVVSSLAGSFEGEYAHTQLIAELASHNHPGSTYDPYIRTQTAASGGGVGVASDSGTGSLTLTIASQGSSTPFNVTQPGTFYNIYMKL